MSDYQAIEGVSTTLKVLLEDRMVLTDPLLAPSTRAAISVSPPDQKPSQPQQGPRLNLFLYQLSHNPFLRNQEIPGTGGNGYGFPPLALDLRYMLTCYPVTEADDLTSHLVLGDAMRVLHDTPMITEALIRTRGARAGDPILDGSLQGEYERIKLTVHTPELEELTKVWSALQSPYRLSVSLVVSVIQIESNRDRTYPAPVLERKIYPVPFQAPSITAIRPERAGVGQTITISGENLGGSDVTLKIGEVSIPVTPATGSEIQVAIPDDPALEPGATSVRVVVGASEFPHSGFQSNRAVFLLVPRITAASLSGGDLTIDGLRLFSDSLPCRVVLGSTVYTPDQFTTATQTQIQFPVGAIPAGTYRVRVRVGSAESLETTTVIIP